MLVVPQSQDTGHIRCEQVSSIIFIWCLTFLYSFLHPESHSLVKTDHPRTFRSDFCNCGYEEYSSSFSHEQLNAAKVYPADANNKMGISNILVRRETHKQTFLCSNT